MSNTKSNKGVLYTIWCMFGGTACTVVYCVLEHFIKK